MPGVLLCFSASQAHRGAHPTGALRCGSAHQSLKGAPWVGSYFVVQCIRRLMGQPPYCSATDACVWSERGYGDGLCMTQQYHLAFMAAWLSSTGISHHDPLPHIPSICLSAVHSSPCPGFASQSLNSSSQLPHLPGDPHFCLVYVWLRQGLSDSHSF